LEQPLRDQTATSFESDGLLVVTMPALNGGVRAILAAAAPVPSGWYRLRNALLLALLPAALLAGLLAFWLSLSVGRPVSRLAGAAGRVAQGIYDDPPLAEGSDELGRLAVDFNRMRAQVRQAQEGQRDFLAGVSHDLKTPLAILQGYVSALEDGVAEDEASRHRALAGIRRETGRMSELISALVELRRLQAGLTPFHPQQLDLAGLARQTLEAFASRLEQKGIHIHDELPSRLPLEQADAGLLSRVVANLLENALRHTPQGGEIRLGGEAAGGEVRLWLHDSGPGIPLEALPRIFEPFYQADAARSAGRAGSGLGLAICRQIMTLHGGEIRTENAVGGGARFILTFDV
jgi:histidine kinase